MLRDRAADVVVTIARAVRSLRRARGFSIAVVVTTAIGIAAIATIYSWIEVVYTHALPYRDANRIVALSEQRGGPAHAGFSEVSLPAATLIRRNARSFERMAVYAWYPAILTGGKAPQYLSALGIDTSFAPLFGLYPTIGRLMTAEEIRNGLPVAMVSTKVWRSAFGATTDALGKTISVDGRAHTIVGVLPEGFAFPSFNDAIFPLRVVPDTSTQASEWIVSVIGKLRPGVSKETARRELDALSPRLREQYGPVYKGAQLLVRDEMLDRRGQQFMPLPELFLGAGAFLLLIACANVTSLFYVRSSSQVGATAVRAALGATRRQLIGHLLAESLVLTTAGAAIGFAVAWIVLHLRMRLLITNGVSWLDPSIDWRLAVFALVVTGGAGIVAGLPSALASTRQNLVERLNTLSGRGGPSASIARGHTRTLIVQVALAVALFVPAVLLARSFRALASVDLGYPADRIVSVRPGYDYDRYSTGDALTDAMEQTVRDVAGVPPVRMAALRGNFAHLREETKQSTFGGPGNRIVFILGERERRVLVTFPYAAVVSNDYFSVLGVKVRAGRSFGPTDAAGSPPVAVLSARVARELWGRPDVVGRMIRLGRDGPTVTVIGVVEDVRSVLMSHGSMHRADPVEAIYLSSRQAAVTNPEIVAVGLSDRNLPAVDDAIARALQRVDRTFVTPSRNTTLADLEIEGVQGYTRYFGKIIGSFAFCAVVLAVLGIYGVVRFIVVQRTQEIAVRRALGAPDGRVVISLVAQNGGRIAIGLIVGLGLAAALAKALQRFLFDVSYLDRAVYVAVLLTFGLIALAASYLAARRATKIDPISVLRAQ